MIRKSLFVLALSLAALVGSAQIGSGQWKIHPYFVNEKVTNCIDVGDKVYYLVSGSLFCYDKASQDNGVIDVEGIINDVNIKNIYYNYNKDYLFIAYDNCNIDIIKGDGTVVNVSAIKDVILNRTKTINDITFGDMVTYVATSFGYIVIEDDTFRVKEVRYFDVNLPSLAQVGDYKILSVSGKFYYSLASAQVEALRYYQQADNSLGNGTIYPIDGTHFFLATGSAFYRVGYSVNSDGTLTFTPTLITNNVPGSIQKYPDGYVASLFNTAGVGYYTFAGDGSNATRHTGEGVYTSRESGNWWIMGDNGLVHEVNGVMAETITPNGITIKARAYWTTYDPYMQRVLLSRTAENRVLEVWDA